MSYPVEDREGFLVQRRCAGPLCRERHRLFGEVGVSLPGKRALTCDECSNAFPLGTLTQILQTHVDADTIQEWSLLGPIHTVLRGRVILLLNSIAKQDQKRTRARQPTLKPCAPVSQAWGFHI